MGEVRERYEEGRSVGDFCAGSLVCSEIHLQVRADCDCALLKGL